MVELLNDTQTQQSRGSELGTIFTCHAHRLSRLPLPHAMGNSLTGPTIRQVQLSDKSDYQTSTTIRQVRLSDNVRSDYQTSQTIKQVRLSDRSVYQTGPTIRQVRLSDSFNNNNK